MEWEGEAPDSTRKHDAPWLTNDQKGACCFTGWMKSDEIRKNMNWQSDAKNCVATIFETQK